MLFFFPFAKILFLVALFYAFSGFTEIVLRFSFLNVSYLIFQALFSLCFPNVDYFQPSIIGLGFSGVLGYFIPDRMLNIFGLFVSFGGTIYKMFESLQVLTTIFQTSRKLKEQMEKSTSFYAGIILILTLCCVTFAMLYDYYFFRVIKEKITDNNYNSAKFDIIKSYAYFSRLVLTFIIVIQVGSILFTVLKANYDSVILNSAAFGLYASLLCFQILTQFNMLNSACVLKDGSIVRGLLSYTIFEKERGVSNMIKNCLDTSFTTNLAIPIMLFFSFPHTLTEWKLFWTGTKFAIFSFYDNYCIRTPLIEKGMKKQLFLKSISILFVLAGTDTLLQNEHSIILTYINLALGIKVIKLLNFERLHIFYLKDIRRRSFQCIKPWCNLLTLLLGLGYSCFA